MKVRLALTFEVTRSRSRTPSPDAEPPYVDEAAGATTEVFPQVDHARPTVGFGVEPEWEDRGRRR